MTAAQIKKSDLPLSDKPSSGMQNCTEMEKDTTAFHQLSERKSSAAKKGGIAGTVRGCTGAITQFGIARLIACEMKIMDLMGEENRLLFEVL